MIHTTSWMDLNSIRLRERLYTVWFHYDNVEKAKLEWQKADQCLPGAGRKGKGSNPKGAQGNFGRWRRCSMTWSQWWLHDWVCLLKSVKLRPGKGWIFLKTNQAVLRLTVSACPSQVPATKPFPGLFLVASAPAHYAHAHVASPIPHLCFFMVTLWPTHPLESSYSSSRLPANSHFPKGPFSPLPSQSGIPFSLFFLLR